MTDEVVHHLLVTLIGCMLHRIHSILQHNMLFLQPAVQWAAYVVCKKVMFSLSLSIHNEEGRGGNGGGGGTYPINAPRVPKAMVILSLACFLACTLFLRFTSGQCLLMASHITYMCSSAEVGCRDSNGRPPTQQADALSTTIP